MLVIVQLQTRRIERRDTIYGVRAQNIQTISLDFPLDKQV